MKYEIEKEYKKLNYKLKTNDIVYKGKYYKWNEKTMTCEDWNINKEEYIIKDIKEIIKDIWYNYEIQNIKTNEIRIEQTGHTLYEKTRLNNIINKNKKNKYTQLTIFDYMEEEQWKILL